MKLQIASITTIMLLEWDSGKNQIIIAGIVVVVLCLMPFLAIWILNRYFKNLGKPSMMAKIGSLYLGLKTDQKWAPLAYSPIFLILRMIFVAITFLIAEQPNLQVHLFICMLLWYVIYIETATPYEIRFQIT